MHNFKLSIDARSAPSMTSLIPMFSLAEHSMKLLARIFLASFSPFVFVITVSELSLFLKSIFVAKVVEN